MTHHDPIPARLAALKTTPTPDLKKQWRELFDSEPPPFNRRYLESRLAYRIQELAYGGLKPEMIRRLERLGDDLDGGDKKKRGMRADAMPITGTRLLREWQGVERVELLLQTFLRGFPRVNGATEFSNDRFVHDRPLWLLSPKNTQPFQRVPVMARAIADSDL